MSIASGPVGALINEIITPKRINHEPQRSTNRRNARPVQCGEPDSQGAAQTIKQFSDDKMKEMLTAHLEETKGQVERLRTIFEHHGKKPTGQALQRHGRLHQGSDGGSGGRRGGALKDAGIIGASLRTEHYEIAGYSAAIAMAKTLEEDEVVKLLTETLQEEQAAAKNILSGSTAILKEAAAQEDEKDDEEEEDEKKDPEEQESEKMRRKLLRSWGISPRRNLQRSQKVAL